MLKETDDLQRISNYCGNAQNKQNAQNQVVKPAWNREDYSRNRNSPILQVAMKSYLMGVSVEATAYYGQF